MSSYRFLQDHSIAGLYYQAGSTASTQDVGGTLPAGWVPSGQVDPTDGPAVSAFWSAGVQLLGLVRAQFNGINVAPPVTFWKVDPAAGPGNPYRQFVLAGLGAGMPMVQLIGTRGVQP